jgi:hypothetical protein
MAPADDMINIIGLLTKAKHRTNIDTLWVRSYAIIPEDN